ncbi:LV223 protein, partial [Amia calva]|nr:LV223 protein [Amia calva]
EGASVTLNCSYSTSSPGPRLFWYQQFPSSAPQFMVMTGAGTSSTLYQKSNLFTDRFSSKADKELTMFVISSLKVSDSATYHCALQPTMCHFQGTSCT